MARCGKKEAGDDLMIAIENETVSAPLIVGGVLGQLTKALAEKGLAEAPRWAATLLAAVLDAPTSDLMRRRGDPLTTAQAGRLRELMEQVTPDAPVAYLVGRASFLGRDFAVTPDTLIPKRDTELFLEIIFGHLEQHPLPPDPHILELCCGSGCVAVVLAERLPGSRVVATDISAAALAVARRNIADYGLEERVALGEGDLFAPAVTLAAGRPFDLIVSNPPYIPTENIPGMGRTVAEHEPRLALDGGADGLDPHRRILAGAPAFLAACGRVFLEHEHYHGAAARALAEDVPALKDVRTFRDANGRDRALYARRR